MEILKNRILSEGIVNIGGILKVDTFINQMVDTELMENIGAEISRRFSDEKITKILTLESSGIPFACEAARQMGIPAVFARKHDYVTLDDGIHQSRVFSYTKRRELVIKVGKNHIKETDRVLIIDDFLANGSAAMGLLDILNQAGASVVGICVLIEKGFQSGRKKLEEKGVRLESLVIIESMENGEVRFK